MRISTADWGDLLTDRPGNGNVSDDGERGRRCRRMNTQQPTRNAQRSSNDNDKRQRHGDHGCMIQQKEIDDTDIDHYMLSDLLYRAAALTDDEGAIVETYDCDAYGNTIAYNADGVDNTWFTDDDVATNNPTCQFIFTGRRFDPETSNATTQMYFYRARYYSPALGRFISRDPVDYEGGMNLYGYVGGMATGSVDPMGLVHPGVSVIMEPKGRGSKILVRGLNRRFLFTSKADFAKRHKTILPKGIQQSVRNQIITQTVLNKAPDFLYSWLGSLAINLFQGMVLREQILAVCESGGPWGTPNMGEIQKRRDTGDVFGRLNDLIHVTAPESVTGIFAAGAGFGFPVDFKPTVSAQLFFRIRCRDDEPVIQYWITQTATVRETKSGMNVMVLGKSVAVGTIKGNNVWKPIINSCCLFCRRRKKLC